jgi:hypothetical protein
VIPPPRQALGLYAQSNWLRGGPYEIRCQEWLAPVLYDPVSRQLSDRLSRRPSVRLFPRPGSRTAIQSEPPSGKIRFNQFRAFFGQSLNFLARRCNIHADRGHLLNRWDLRVMGKLIEGARLFHTSETLNTIASVSLGNPARLKSLMADAEHSDPSYPIKTLNFFDILFFTNLILTRATHFREQFRPSTSLWTQRLTIRFRGRIV